ncbi:MAG: DUF192 domain-containing protein [Pseudomonadota bacterium]
MRRPILLFLLSALVGGMSVTLSACDSPPDVTELNEPLLDDFARDSLSIRTQSGDTLDFTVYVARTSEQMSQGLMFVRELPDRTGMLFTYSRRRIASMWMKNTYIPLDILFIKQDGTISDIHANTTPKSLKSRRSSGPVRGALELEAGSVERLGIQIGDTVLHSHFRTR